MKQLFITGFEPFGGEIINPSWEAVSRLPDTIGEYTLTKLCIPVVFGQSAEIIIKKRKKFALTLFYVLVRQGAGMRLRPKWWG